MERDVLLLIVLCFFIANAPYAVAMWRRGGMSRIVGAFDAAAALR